jgi:MFS family permease
MSSAAAPRTAPVRMTAAERRATIGLASIVGLRMLGMFAILPVFALFAVSLPGGGDRTLVGLALGAYGLTQALLQIPFGWASDRWGRKPVIYSGLVLFALGSFVAATAPDIYWMIAGRTLQGAGAISAVVIALSADLTRDAVRTRAMAAIGMTIGGVFALSLVGGPPLAARIGVPGIFAVTGLLALGAIAGARFLIPVPPAAATRTTTTIPRGLAHVLRDVALRRLNYGIFALHALLTALFIEVPFALRDGGLPVERHWEVYLPVVVLSFALMWPFVRSADRPRQARPVFTGAICALLVAQAALAFGLRSLPATVAALLLFFTAFNLLEAMLPALVSRLAPAELKGTAVGVYSSVQFLGMFVGAVVGGALAEFVSAAAVFGFGVVLTAIWLAVSAPSPSVKHSMGET